MIRRILLAVLTVIVAGTLFMAYGYRPAVADYRPPPMHSRYVDTPMARFHYLKEGSGPPVVLLSPGASWVYGWREQLPVLAKKHTVYVVDLPGQGFTRLHEPFGWDLDGMTRAIGVFLDSVGLTRVSMAGNSWSGGWALAYAQRNPTRVDRLALLDSSGLNEADISAWEMLKYPVLGEIMTKLGYASRDMVRPVLERIFVNKWRITDEMVDAFWAPNTFRDNLESNYLLERGLDWRATQRALATTGQPTLVIWGKQDTTLPAWHAQRFGQLMPDAAVHVLDGCAHAVMLDCPGQVNDLLTGFFA